MVEYMDMLTEGNLIADGSEQTIIETKGPPSFTLNGWLSLSNMEGGDTIEIKQYIRLEKEGNWIKYAEENYSDIQASPGLFVTTKPAYYGLKITLKQIAGDHKAFEYNVFRQRIVRDRGSIVFTS